MGTTHATEVTGAHHLTAAETFQNDYGVVEAVHLSAADIGILTASRSETDGSEMVCPFLSPWVAGDYDSCGRPDAVYASWDQAIFPPRTPPCPTTLMRPVTDMRHHAHAPNHHHAPPCSCQRSLPTIPRGQGHGTSYAYGGVESGDHIYIVGRACASPSHAAITQRIIHRSSHFVAGSATFPWPPFTSPALTRTTTESSPRTIPSTR